MTWTVTGRAGTATLTFRYANGTTVNRPTAISVNGGTAVTVNFPSTGTWENWTSTSIAVTLAAGTDTVKATSTTADGAPNLDYVEVTQ
jgi:hypothetical protein